MLFLGENFLAFRDRLLLYADHLRLGLESDPDAAS